jgi:hypothetical protein
VAIARSLADQTFVRCTLVELHSAKVRTPQHATSCSFGIEHRLTMRHIPVFVLQVKVVSVKTDLRYWPCWQLSLNPATGEWQREVLSNAGTKSPNAASS